MQKALRLNTLTGSPFSFSTRTESPLSKKPSANFDKPALCAAPSHFFEADCCFPRTHSIAALLGPTKGFTLTTFELSPIVLSFHPIFISRSIRLPAFRSEPYLILRHQDSRAYLAMRSFFLKYIS